MPAVPGGSLLREASLTGDVDRFCVRFKYEISECIKNAYSLFRDVYRSPRSGSLSTSISEDVMSLLWLQNEILTEYIAQNVSDRPSLEVDIYQSMFRTLKVAQTNLLPMLLHSFESCCAASNDFYRLANKLEVYVENVVPVEARDDGMDMVAKLSQDAVYAAERTQIFFIRQLNQTNIPHNFFSPSWENDWTHNEVMVEVLDKLDRLLTLAESCLDNDFLYSKVVVSSCKALVCFYIRCLVDKADAVCRRKRRSSRGVIEKPFINPQRALLRMNDDIRLLNQFFADEVSDTDVALSRILVNEMRMLEVIYECLSASDDSDSLESIIVVVHKRTGADAMVTRYFVGDLWALVTKQQASRGRKGNRLHDILSSLQPDLEMVSMGMKENGHKRFPATDLQFLHIDEMLRAIYEDRIAQGLLPLCWTCLPKVESSEGSKQVVAEKVRKITRRLTEKKPRSPRARAVA